MIYLDHNATTPILPEVQDTLQKLYLEEYGNPSSPYLLGRRARDLLEESRSRLADLLGVKAAELIFTSGGSEGNNMVLRQLLFLEKPGHLIVSAVEHPSVLETANWLSRKKNLDLSILPVDQTGKVKPETLEASIQPNSCMVSVMAANNETGTIQPFREMARIARNAGVDFHSDCVQYAGKLDLNLASSGLDYATLTAHKMGGPKGIGLLYIREGSQLFPLISGGGQERSLRAGTENVALACAFAESLDWFSSHRSKLENQWLSYRKHLLQQLQDLEIFFLLGDPETNLPNTLNLGFRGISAESLLICLDLDGIAVSTGSACSSGALEASHVLLAMGCSHQEAKSSLRISMGWNTTEEEIDQLANRLVHHVQRLKPISGKSSSPTRSITEMLEES